MSRNLKELIRQMTLEEKAGLVRERISGTQWGSKG